MKEELKELEAVFNSLDLIENIGEFGWTPQLEDLFGEELRSNGIDTNGNVIEQLYNKITNDNEELGAVGGVVAFTSIYLTMIFIVLSMIVITTKIMYIKHMNILKNNRVFEFIKKEDISSLAIKPNDYIFSYGYLSSMLKLVTQNIKLLFGTNNKDILLDTNKLHRINGYRNNIKKTSMDKKIETFYGVDSTGINSDGDIIISCNVLRMDVDILGQLGYTTNNVLSLRKDILSLHEYLYSISLKKKVLINKAKEIKTPDISKRDYKACKKLLKKIVRQLYFDIRDIVYIHNLVIRKTATIKYKRYK